MSVCYNFSAAKKRQQEIKVAGETKKRGAELLDIIQLDVLKIDLLELTPSSNYELYINRYGRSNAKPVGVSTADETQSAEIQTDTIQLVSKWIQFPPSFSGKLASFSSKDYLGVGGDGVASSNVSAPSFDEFMATAGSSSANNETDLGEFIESAGQVVSALFQEEAESSDSIESMAAVIILHRLPTVVWLLAKQAVIRCSKGDWFLKLSFLLVCPACCSLVIKHKLET
jgi:hypothetical protein